MSRLGRQMMTRRYARPPIAVGPTNATITLTTNVVTATATVTRRPAHTFTTSIATASAAVTRLVGRTFTPSVVTASASLARQPGKRLAATANAAAALTRSAIHLFVATGTAAAALTRTPARTLAPQRAGNVTVDAATDGSAGLTFAHTCSGTNRYLVVGVAIANTTTTVSSVTYNGVALTLIRRAVGPNFGSELWGLIAPATGTNNVVVTMSGAVGTSQGAVSFNAANQSEQTGPSGANASAGFSPVTSAAVTAPIGSVLVDMVAANSTLTPTGNGTQAWNDGSGDEQSTIPGNGQPQTLGWTAAGSWTSAIVAVMPMGAAAGSTTLALVKVKTLLLTASANAVAALTRQANHILTATATASATLAKKVLRTFTATANAAATITLTKVKTLLLTASANAAATLVRQAQKLLAPQATASVSIQKQPRHTFTTTANAAATLTMTKVKTLLLTATANAAAAMSRVAARQLAAAATASAVVQKKPARTFSSTATAAASLRRAPIHVLTTTASASATLTRTPIRVLRATANAVATIATLLIHALTQWPPVASWFGASGTSGQSDAEGATGLVFGLPHGANDAIGGDGRTDA